jgi:hypothetical protein
MIFVAVIECYDQWLGWERLADLRSRVHVVGQTYDVVSLSQGVKMMIRSFWRKLMVDENRDVPSLHNLADEVRHSRHPQKEEGRSF